MFSKEGFIEDCRAAIGEGQQAIRALVAEAVADPAALLKELGEPEHAGIVPLYNAPDLTIVNLTWAPCMSVLPHNHEMFAVIGIYGGREDNLFWRRREDTIEAAGAKSLGCGDVATLGPDIIHSVTNPIAKMTGALHVYGGNFFDPPTQRSEWEHETLEERPWSADTARRAFSEAEARFNALAAAAQ